MEVTINNNKLTLLIGDITNQNTQAIVNSANPSLLAGSGVCGSIHQKAGTALEEECRKYIKEELNDTYLPIGETILTSGYNLCEYVFHTVGPIWGVHGGQEEELLYKAYKNTLASAIQNSIHSISFPSISTGIHRFPMELASKIAVTTILETLTNNEGLDVQIVLFSYEDYNAYKKVLENQIG